MSDRPLAHPRFVPGLIALASAAALAVAVVAERGFGLEPCVLCLYQRDAYWAALVFGLAGVALGRRPGRRRALVALGGLALLASAAVAFFQVGVEQAWWRGTSGCHAPAIEPGLTVEELREVLEARERVVPCDEVTWSLFGISLAGYNFLLAGALAVAALWAAWHTPTRGEA